MKQAQEAADRLHLLDGDPLDTLRLSYPELDFVWEYIDKLRGQVDDLTDRLNDLEGG